MNNPLSTDERARIRALLLAGQSHNAIAKQVGRSQSTISAFASREGISPVNQAPRAAIERRKEFALEARLEAMREENRRNAENILRELRRQSEREKSKRQ